MCEGVLLELYLCDIQRIRIWIRVALVSVKLVEWFLLVVLGPATVRCVHAPIYTAGVTPNRRETTTLLQSTFTDIHSTRVTHTIRLPTPIFWSETVLHEFVVGARSHLGGCTVCIRPVEAAYTWCGLVVETVLLIVAISLKSSWILGHRLGWNKSLRAVEAKSIIAQTSF